MTDTFKAFLEHHIARIEPMSRELHVAYWNATISGKKADFERFAKLDTEFQKVYSETGPYQSIERWLSQGDVTDPIEKRQLDLLRNAFLRNQIDPALIETMSRLSSSIVNQFNIFRAEVDGSHLTGNEIRSVLRQSTDSHYRRRVWEAEKRVGDAVVDDLLQLVSARNEAARSIGFGDYYSMSLELSEQNADDVLKLFDRLEELTKAPFAEMKNEVDALLAARYGIGSEDLLPWHYEDPFFQEAPRVYDVDLDRYYRDHEILELVENFYVGIGLEVGDILRRSDLYEKAGKEQHAYCMDLDRKGDIRVLANIQNDETWTGTMLHELGHAVYDLYIDTELPFLLREHAHVFATEAIAMLFGRLSKDVSWIQLQTGISGEEKTKIADTASKSQRLSQLIFARWCQVMVRFERELYRDPEQDLNALWWDLVERYQMMTRPAGRDAPDWASKIHVVSAPVYYHNYMLGELLASQLDHHIHSRILGAGNGREPVNDRPEVGSYLKEQIFRPGKRYRWSEMIERATGEPLNPAYFVEQYVSR